MVKIEELPKCKTPGNTLYPNVIWDYVILCYVIWENGIAGIPLPTNMAATI